MKKILVSGSFVFDTILLYHGQFKDQIMPDKVHAINTSFETPELRREFGGCGANITFNIKALGGNPLPISTVGKDGEEYKKYFDDMNINTKHIKVYNDYHTAQAFLLTDLGNNQITAFHPGAMKMAHETSIPTDEDFSIAIVSPNSKLGMIKHANELSQLNIPFIFDPGQALGLFNGQELIDIISKATYIAVNDYESSLLEKKTGLSATEIAHLVSGLIITKGGDGSEILMNNQVVFVPPVKPEKIVDPTGCGDSYRGAVLHALSQGADIVEACRLGSKMGSLKIAVSGGQNHFQHITENFNEFQIKSKTEFHIKI